MKTVSIMKLDNTADQWNFHDEYELYQVGNAIGLKEHWLEFVPSNPINDIRLIQVACTYSGDDVLYPNDQNEEEILRNRTAGNGFRIDVDLDSNNPYFGAVDEGESRHHFSHYGEHHSINASRKDDPAILDISDLESYPIGQTFITAAYDYSNNCFLGSISYGWELAEKENLQVLGICYTVNGISQIFIDALIKWNEISGVEQISIDGLVPVDVISEWSS